MACYGEEAGLGDIGCLGTKVGLLQGLGCRRELHQALLRTPAPEDLSQDKPRPNHDPEAGHRLQHDRRQRREGGNGTNRGKEKHQSCGGDKAALASAGCFGGSGRDIRNQ